MKYSPVARTWKREERCKVDILDTLRACAVNFGNKCPQNEEIICQSLMSDDQTVASRINQFRGDRLCVIDGQQTFDLAEEPIDQAEITA